MGPPAEAIRQGQARTGGHAERRQKRRAGFGGSRVITPVQEQQ